MNILAIETATDACSAALLSHTAIASDYQVAPRQHTQLILPMVEQLLADAELTLRQLDAIAFGCGPGAFTGLRIAAGVTQGLALAADLPVIPVSTLAAMAQQAWKHYQARRILVALDARIDEVYWGCYEVVGERVCLQGDEQVIRPELLDFKVEQEDVAVGSGWEVYADILYKKITLDQMPIRIEAHIKPAAEFVVQLAAYDYQQGRVLSVEDAQPVYLRDKVADTIQERKQKNHVKSTR